MVSMKNIAWKAGAAATLAAAIVGLSVGQASAAGWTEEFHSKWYEGKTSADATSQANKELPALIAQCVARGGSPTKSYGSDITLKGGNHLVQVHLPCRHQ